MFLLKYQIAVDKVKGLAKAIDAAFARWDLAHLHEFQFPDGRTFGTPDGEFDLPIDDEKVRVGQAVRKGDTFVYVFDLGDQWAHCCRVEQTGLDPVQVAGIVPDRPIPIWGMGLDTGPLWPPLGR